MFRRFWTPHLDALTTEIAQGQEDNDEKRDVKMIERHLHDQINEVRRAVGDRVLEAGEARVVTLSQSYADRRRGSLGRLLTNIERIPRWSPADHRSNWRWAESTNSRATPTGTIQTCDPPREFTATWEYGGGVSWIEVRVSSEGLDRSRLDLEHIAHVEDHWEQFGPGAVGIGWDLGLVGLAIHLSTGEALDPSFGQQWTTSDDGRRFMHLSSEAWYEASVAGGADPASARQAADRCAVPTWQRHKTRTRSSFLGSPEIFSRRCQTRHLSRLPG